jgi:signal peptidase I
MPATFIRRPGRDLALSDSLSDSLQSNNQPNPELTSPAKPEQPLWSDRSGQNYLAGASELPLPDFSAAAEPEPVDAPSLPPHIEDSSHPEEIELEPSYKLSPAEPADWSEFIGSPATEPAEPVAAESEAGRSSWQTAWAVIREVGETILLTLIIFLLIQTVIRNFRVVGTSMVDNLHDGQYLIIDKISYNPLVHDVLGVGGPQRGDVIVFEPPNRPGEDYVKRIIGLPGETVEVRNGQVLINGQPLAEPFQPGRMSYTMRPQVVPDSTVFVLGDNRNNSNDSHNWGALPVENIVGRAWLSYWPPQNWGVIPRDKPTAEATLKYVLEQLVPNANAGSQ